MTIECANPYPGPESFERGDSRPYFGREQEANDLTSLAVIERLLVFYAPSGAGKTSLLNKKLIPRLEDKLYEVLPTGRVSGAASLPANVRNVFAYNLMLRLARDDPEPERFAELRLSDFLWHLSTEDGKVYHYDPSDQALRVATPARDLWPRVLILDQFEEIITAYPALWRHREDFFRQVDEALSADPLLRVLMSLRSDYVQDLERYAGLLQHGLRARYQMLLMSTGDAQKAIEGPAKECGRPFAEGVASQLVENMSQVRDVDAEGKIYAAPGETVEPIQLQVVCYQLWESIKQTPGERIEREDLKRLARESAEQRAVDGSLSLDPEDQLLSVFVDGALGAFYNRALERARVAAVAPMDEAFLRNWFSTKLITEAGARGFLQRGHDETGGVPEETVQNLIDNHLLRSDTRGSVRLVELIHDRFVQPIRTANLNWNQRRRREQPWIDAAYAWYESGDSPEMRNAALLLQDDTLRTVLAQAAGHEHEPQVADYLAASKAAQDRREQAAALDTARRRADEARLRAEEAKQGEEAALRLAELETQAASQLRTRNIWLIALAGSVFALLLVVGVMALNLNDRNQALSKEKSDLEAARFENQSLMLADQSRRAALEDGLLLARAAMSASNTVAAAGALLEALDQGFRDESGNVAPYVPHTPIDLVPSARLWSVAFSGDGKLLAVGDESGGITLWDNGAKQPLGERIQAHGAGSIYGMAFDPLRPRLASASGDRDNPSAPLHDLILWDLADPTDPRSTILTAGQPSIWSLAFSRDGGLLAVGNQDGTVAIWDLAGSAPISRTLPGGHSDWAFSVAFDPQGSRLASAGRDRTIILWDDVAGSAPSAQTLRGHTAWVNDVTFSPDGSLLASASDDSTVRLWNLAGSSPESTVLEERYGPEAWELAFSPDGGTLAAGWSDGVTQIYDLDERDKPPLPLQGDSGGTWDLAFEPTTRRLVTLSRDELYPMVWDLSTDPEFASVQPISLAPNIVHTAISSDGRWLAAVDADHQVYVGETASSTQLVSFTVGISVTALAIDAAGRQLAVAGCALPGSGPMSNPTPVPAEKGNGPPLAEPSSIPTDAGSGAAAAAKADSCGVEIWSIADGQPVTRVSTMLVAQPVRALAFPPEVTGELADAIAVGLESGSVQVQDLSTAAAETLEGDEIRELTDLAFSSSGQHLAALGENGWINVWNWPSRALVHKSEAGEGEEFIEQTRFDDVAFVGDQWLAVSVDQPDEGETPDEVEIWTVQPAEPVADFALNSGAAADLAYDPGQQLLFAVQPNRLLGWTMSPERWFELACARAGRNLTYDEWQDAFPGEEDFKTARICLNYPLDASFAQVLIDEAKKEINDCTAEQWANGMALLVDAKGLPVEPPLVHDPLDEAVAIVSDQALDYLRQQAPGYDEDARQCLALAADQLSQAGRAAFDLAQAEAVGRRQAQFESVLANPSAADVEELRSDLAWIQDHEDEWPAPLPKRMLKAGDQVTGIIAPNQHPSFAFFGQKGQVATVDMVASGVGLDAAVSLEGPGGVFLTSNSDRGDRRIRIPIEEQVLSADGIYRIVAGAYSGRGSYRLSLTLSTPSRLELGQPMVSAGANGGQWLFDGKAGDVLLLALEPEVNSEAARLKLARTGDIYDYQVSYGNVDNPEVRISTILRGDDLYVATVTMPDDTGTYTLTANTLSPPLLEAGKTIVASASITDIWSIDGIAGQVISLSVSSGVGGSSPSLSLFSDRGESLKVGEAEAETSLVRIAGYVIPRTARYYVRVSDLEAYTPYQVQLRELQPAELAVGQSVTAHTDDPAFWKLVASPGSVIQISLDARSDSNLDPLVRLFDAESRQVDWNDDGGVGTNSRLTLVLPASPSYLVQADRFSGSGAYDLTIAELQPEALPIDGSSIPVAADRAWRVSGEAGQVFTVTVSDDGDDSYPYLQLVTTGGAVLATSDGGPLLAALLPQEGDYLLLPRDVADSGATTMTASVVDIAITPESASQVGSSTLHSLARGKAIDQALNFYRWGTTGQDVGFTPDAIFDLCWFGVLDGAADQVLDICEGLVASPGTTDPYSIARYRDARGLARALNGNTAGALEDFAYYAGQGGSYAAQRQEWVDRLRDGEAVSNVLNAEMLQSLLTQY